MRAPITALLLLSVSALAQEGDEEPEPEPAPDTSVVIFESAPDTPRNFGNFRAGAGSSSENGHPYLCLEGSPLALLAIEACGTGSGFLHNDEAPETAHFRSKLRMGSYKWRDGFLQPHFALGFAELQIAEDTSGFDFAGTGPDGVETAGPEVGLGLRMVVPISRTVEIVGDAGVSYAWMPHAPDLIEPHSAHQLSASFTLGVGF